MIYFDGFENTFFYLERLSVSFLLYENDLLPSYDMN